MLEQTWSDIRHATRSLVRTPSFSLAAVLTLALGIGANTAIFSLLNELLLRPLPISAPDELFNLREGDYSYAAYETFQRDNVDLIDLFASGPIERVAAEVTPGGTEPVSLSLVSGSYFPVLGVPAFLGRTFTTADETATSSSVAVLSHAFWQTRFGSEPSVIGRSLRVGAGVATIVGVAPPAFAGERAGVAPDIWAPLALRPRLIQGRDLLVSPTSSWLQVTGRLRPGVALERAEAVLTTQYRRVLADAMGPELSERVARDIREEQVSLLSARTGVPTRLRDQFEAPLTLSMVGVALLLLLACANVSNLMLARGVARRREVAVRLALGGSTARIARELLAESLLLAGAGALAGIMLAWLTRAAVVGLIFLDGRPESLGQGIDARVLFFTVVASLLTTVAFGAGPIWQARTMRPARGLGSRETGLSEPRSRLTRGLVVAQVAVSLVLLTAAALFIRTLVNVRDTPLGYGQERLVLLDIEPRAAGYQEANYADLVTRLEQRLGRIPGVVSASSTANGVLTGRDSGTSGMGPVGAATGPDGQFAQSRYDNVGPSYFETMHIPLVAGREFDARDRPGSPGVVIVNDTLARTMFPGSNPVGQRLRWTRRDSPVTDWDVVGVVRDVRQNSPREDIRPRFYLPGQQHPEDAYPTVFVLRTLTNPTATLALAREVVRAEDPTLPIRSATTGEDLFGRAVAQERLLALAAGVFSALATVLAALGIYGLLAFTVRRRTSEVGLRLAIGARPVDVVRLVIRDGMVLVLGGVVLGALGTIAATRALETLLFGVTPTDVSAHAAAISLIVLVGLLACCLPARRASRVDPMTALRAE